jgi:predicted nucleotidyltransferase component of viral defense system
MALEELSSYYLVGGTALALQLGHRVSVDLDFFGKTLKIRAIEDRTTKKDFYDLYALLEKFSLEEILSFASKKYNSKSPLFAVECIMDIDQADLEINPVSLIDLNWDIVKSRIIKEARKILL